MAEVYVEVGLTPCSGSVNPQHVDTYIEVVGKMVDGHRKVTKDDGCPIWAVRVLVRRRLDVEPSPSGAADRHEP